MIRRSDGAAGEERWILISQVEHARLAAALADSWLGGSQASFAAHDQLVGAIRRHDDGWSAWEVAPKVDPQTGRPLDFTETPLTDSLAIWRDSIHAAADLGPLPAYMVSGHFSALLERFSSRWKSDTTLTKLANDFLSEQRGERERWLSMWRKVAGDVEGESASSMQNHDATPQAADQAVGWLQMFDAMSLWFCCAERDRAERFATPAGGQITLRPVSGPYDIEVSPWPGRSAALHLEAVGRSIPAQRYADPSDVVTARAKGVTLRWSLRPASG